VLDDLLQVPSTLTKAEDRDLGETEDRDLGETIEDQIHIGEMHKRIFAL